MAVLGVILVDPEHPGNVGAIARLMRNFGSGELVLVRGVEIDDHARNRAKHAQDVLDNSVRVATLDEALKRFDLTVAASCRLTGREQGYHRNPVEVRDFAPRLAETSGRVALVFGREGDGLTNEEIKKCDAVVTVPTAPDYRSMNVSMACAVALYECWLASTYPKPKEFELATEAEKEKLFDVLELLLHSLDYPTHRRDATMTMVRRLLGRAVPTAWEFHTLMGVLTRTLHSMGKWDGNYDDGDHPFGLPDEVVPLESLDSMAPRRAVGGG